MLINRIFCAFAVLAFAATAFAQADPDVIPSQYIVVLSDSTPDPAQVANEMGRVHGLSVRHVYNYALKGFSATMPAGRLTALSHDPRVLFVSEDRIVTAFAMPTGVDRVNAERPFPTATSTGEGVTVAVIDTGIDFNHSDLSGHNSSLGKNCVTSGAPPADDNGHGTHVAGTVAAYGSIVGVATSAKLAAVKVLDSRGSGSWSKVICGIDYVTANAATIKVANMSLGGSGSDSPSNADCTNPAKDALHTAICRSVKAGVTYAVAAGNGNWIGIAQDVRKYVPASYDEVITVSALADSDGKPCGLGSSTAYGRDDTFASFSNYATLAADLQRMIGAPGVNIYSTKMGGGYTTMSGTSMAAPHVAGAAALYISGHSAATAADVRAALIAAGEPPAANFQSGGVSDCSGSAVSHTNSNGKHPERVLRADTF